MKPRVAVGGNNLLATQVARWLAHQPVDLRLLLAEGRDDPWETSFEKAGHELAQETGVPFVVGPINEAATRLAAERLDLLVLCRCKGRIAPSVLQAPRLGCTNLHYGMLPKYGGIGPIHWALRNGETQVGVTLHWMSEAFDEGDVIAQAAFDVSSRRRRLCLPDRDVAVAGWTAREAYDEANDVARRLFERHAPALLEGRAPRRAQDLASRTYYPKSALDYERDRFIDPRHVDDATLARHVRAFTFPPVQLPATRAYGGYQELILEEA